MLFYFLRNVFYDLVHGSLKRSGSEPVTNQNQQQRKENKKSGKPIDEYEVHQAQKQQAIECVPKEGESFEISIERGDLYANEIFFAADDDGAVGNNLEQTFNAEGFLNDEVIGVAFELGDFICLLAKNPE